MSENKFVFVVCGTREHIETLHFSLKALRHFSKNEVFVVTDASRNEIPVVWDKIIDIKTPEHFSHHQASIYLKTGLHKFLPQGNTYCYLDTDVVALSEKADAVFQHYVSPVTFCSDHCKLESFSPYAVHCNCLKEYEAKQPAPEIVEKGKRLEKMLKAYLSVLPPHVCKRKEALICLLELYRKNQFNTEGLNEEENADMAEIKKQWRQKYEIKGAALQKLFELTSIFSEMKKRPLLFPFYTLKILKHFRKNISDGGWYDRSGNLIYHRNTDIANYLLTFPGYYFDSTTKKVYNKNKKWVYSTEYEFHTFFSNYPEFKWVEKERKWYDHEGNVLIESNYIPFVEEFAKHGFHFNAEEQLWYDEQGNLLLDYPMATISCSHFHDRAREKFGVEIINTNWQHWNGGVFLFNDQSQDFMNFWHEITMKIFEDYQWETRDQGTLAISAWKLGMQNHSLLPLEFNFIADYQHPTMDYLGNLTFDINEKKKNVTPSFIHIYHHWGDTEWDVWRDVYAFINSRT